MNYLKTIMFLLVFSISFSFSLVGCKQLSPPQVENTPQISGSTFAPDINQSQSIPSIIPANSITPFGIETDNESSTRQGFEANLWGVKNPKKLPSADDIFVDNAKGNDLNAGTKDSPVRSVKKGLSLISDKRTRVVIAEGRYKEPGLELKGKGSEASNNSISIEGVGKVVLCQDKGRILFFDNCKKIMLKNIIFDGNGGSDLKEGEGLVTFVGGSSHILIEGCQFNNSTGHGLLLGGSWQFQDRLKPVTNYPEDADKLVWCPVCTDVTIKNCSMTNTSEKPFEIGAWCRDILVENVSVKNCYIRFANKEGGSVTGAMYCKNITFRNVKIISDDAVCPKTPAIWFMCDNWNILIDGVYTQLPKGSAMIIEANPRASVTVRNSVFQNSGGIGLFMTPGTVLENNVIWGNVQLISHWDSDGAGQSWPCQQHPGGHTSVDTKLIGNKFYYIGDNVWAFWWISDYMTFESSGNTFHFPNISNPNGLFQDIKKRIGDSSAVLHTHKHTAALEMLNEK